ncbi:hypothetical protein GGE68_002938 [Rhizobium leguminosarum]|uniref:NUMOD3 domain-containing DNA-binding protein n=1 Tax=Rhizobium leguminosarum TaxID=384 RepID=UPI00160CE5FA|nr:NUMOD3 domain-containing DNA-binding protein [Rhizobium leguminosarum]MBB5664741.1 hypothetical protein [Rhizobium leguminosarum]
MEFYTYIWRDASGTPFYVGKGRDRRAYEVSLARRSKEFREIYDEGGCSVEIVDWFIHESQAHAYEVELIEKYGRREMGGLLINKTDGGDGASGQIQSEETRAKKSASMKGIVRGPMSDEARAKMSLARKGQIIGAEQREKLRIASTGKTHTEETRLKMSESKKGKPGRRRTEDELVKLVTAVRFALPRNTYKGVSFHKSTGKWAARLRINGDYGHIGLFADPRNAALAYDNAAVAAWGVGNCYLNFPEDFTQEDAA